MVGWFGFQSFCFGLYGFGLYGILVGYVMGYQSVEIQFVWSVLQNLMHKLQGTTFIFFLG
jgi:hypothetical protein